MALLPPPKTSTVLFILCLFKVGKISGGQAEENNDSPTLTLARTSVAAREEGFDTFSRLLEENAREMEEMSANLGGGAVTVFAPNDMAFEILGEDYLDALKQSGHLPNVLLYHILPGWLNSTSLLSSPTGDAAFPTLASGGEAKVRANVYLRSRFYQGFATVNGKRLARTDIDPEVEEGEGKIIFHEVSEVLSSLPSGDVVSTLSTMDGGGRFSTFLRLVASSGLGELLSGEEGPITVFAPEEEAFEGWGEGELEEAEGDKESLRELVLRHCLSGALFQKGMSWRVHDTLATVYSDGEEEEDNRVQTQVFKGGVVKVSSGLDSSSARLTQPDILATNGVVHAIDRVI